MGFRKIENIKLDYIVFSNTVNSILVFSHGHMIVQRGGHKTSMIYQCLMIIVKYDSVIDDIYQRKKIKMLHSIYGIYCDNNHVRS